MSARKLREPGKSERENKRKKVETKTATSEEDSDGSDDDNLWQKARVRQKGTKPIVLEDNDELKPENAGPDEDDEESASDDPTEDIRAAAAKTLVTPKPKNGKTSEHKRKPTSANKKNVVDEDSFIKGRPSPLCSSMCGH